MNIPLAKPEIPASDIEAVTAVLRSSRLSQGPALHSFEKALAAYVRVDHAVALNSGTSALQLALRALKIGDGDEVILPSFSFMAVTNAVLTANATPIYVDIAPDTLNLDPKKIEPLLNPRTKAIIVVHTFGLPAPVSEVAAIARRHRLSLIEDSCEALGTEVNGRKAGSFGDVGIFAFYPNKQITTGEGGALVTNSAALADTVRSLSNQGRQPSPQWFQHAEAGFSYRLSEMNCALGLQQLSRIEEILERRAKLACCYRRLLQNSPEIQCYGESPNCRTSWFTYPVLLPGGRDEIWRRLSEIGVETGRYFAPAHLQPVMQKFPFRHADLSRTVSLAERLLCLPFFNSLQEREIEFVCNTLKEILADMTLIGSSSHRKFGRFKC